MAISVRITTELKYGHNTNNCDSPDNSTARSSPDYDQRERAGDKGETPPKNGGARRPE